MNNVKTAWKRSFAIKKYAYTLGAYDYRSVMHFSSITAAKDKKKPVIKPINCGSKCPTLSELGQREGLSKLDVVQLAEMYMCPKQSSWTGKMECEDRSHWLSARKTMNCDKYKRDGGCTRDPTPCCNCGDKGGW